MRENWRQNARGNLFDDLLNFRISMVKNLMEAGVQR